MFSQYRYRGHVASFGGRLGDAFTEGVSPVAGPPRYRGWGVKSADVGAWEYAGPDWVDVDASAEVERVPATAGERAFAALIFLMLHATRARACRKRMRKGSACLAYASCRSRLPCVTGPDGR